MWPNEKGRQIMAQAPPPLTDICEEGRTRREAEANYTEEGSFDLRLRIEL